MRRRLNSSALGWMGAAVLFASLSTTVFTQGARIPRGYAPQPPGANLRVRMATSDDGSFRATVTNDDARQIVGLTFVAIVEVLDTNRPVQVLTSPEWTLSLGPRQSATLMDDWLKQVAGDNFRTDPDQRFQMFLTPSRIRYADGTAWTLPLDTTRTRSLMAIQKAFNLPAGINE